MVKYFMSRLIYFHHPEEMKIKPESEISFHITLQTYSALDTSLPIVSTCNSQPVKLVVGANHTPR